MAEPPNTCPWSFSWYTHWHDLSNRVTNSDLKAAVQHYKQCSKCMQTPIMSRSATVSYRWLQRLLEAGVDPNSTSSTMSHFPVLCDVARYEDSAFLSSWTKADYIRLLLNHGANPNGHDNVPGWNRTAISWLLHNPDFFSFKALFIAGAKVRPIHREAYEKKLISAAPFLQKHDTNITAARILLVMQARGNTIASIIGKDMAKFVCLWIVSRHNLE